MQKFRPAIGPELTTAWNSPAQWKVDATQGYVNELFLKFEPVTGRSYGDIGPLEGVAWSTNAPIGAISGSTVQFRRHSTRFGVLLLSTGIRLESCNR